MKLLILTDSDFKRKFRNLPTNIEADIIEIKLGKFYSAPEKFIKSFYKTIEAFKKFHNHDAVLSVSTLCGLPVSLLQKLVKVIDKPHIMLDIGLPRMISPNNLVATNVFRNLFSSLTHVVCFARGHVYFWKKILNFTNASFVPYGVDPSFYDDFSNCYSNYIFSAGRADRDYNTLLLAVRHIIRPPRLIVTYGKDQITFKSPHFKRDLTNYNVKLFYEVPYDLYLRLLKKSLLVVLPLKKTHYASGQVVLLEAMASGKAVIASRVIGTIDYIENWNTGIFVKPYDFKDLKEKIEYLMENPDERVRIGRNARKTIHERFNEKNMISEIVNTVRNYCA